MQAVPVNYTLTFDVDLEKFTYVGKEVIKIKAKNANKIILDSKGLNIKFCAVRSGKGDIRPKISEKDNELVIKLDRKVSGDAEILIEFAGKLSDVLSGFYRSKYGEGNYIATTHFEPADARTAFPCFDRPDMKATFDISIVHDARLKAISNMPEKENKDVRGKKLTVFEQTPPMSTYLAYLGVGDFEFLEGDAENTKLRVVTVPGKSSQCKFAMECMKKFLKYYNDYFGIKYPLPKLDLIAVPDFASGAMENWGAITFREIELMFDPEVNSMPRKQRIALVIAHEMAHMWFGDLVTMKWWNDLWLNESFATWMEYKAVDNYFREWELWKQFSNDVTAGALGLDSLKSSHPIETEVNNPEEVNEIFDAISYNKGGSIIRMLEDYVGHNAFRKGMALYMQQHEYGNASTEDLWNALEKSSKIGVKKMMSGWIKQTGYPIISVTEKGRSLVLSQSRFLLSGSDSRSRWQIPMKTGKDAFVMAEKTMEIKSLNSKLNAGQAGFYRVAYPGSMLSRMLESIGKMNDIDRWGLQSDLFALCVSSKMKFDAYLNLIKSYSGERDYMVCRDISQSLYYVYLISDGKMREEMKSHIIRFNKNVLSWLGWYPQESENRNYATLRSSVISSLARMGDKEVLERAAKDFENIGNKSIPPDMIGVIYAATAWGGNAKTYETLKQRYVKASNPEEQRRLLIALGAFQDKTLLKQTLDFCMTEHVRPQDTFVIIASLTGNPNGKDMIWPWLKKNWAHLEKIYPGGSFKILSGMLESTKILSSESVEKDILKFFKGRSKGLEMTLPQCIEKIRINRKFLETNKN